MLNLLKTYQNRLVNLTSRNRSLFLPRLYKRQFIDIHAFNFAENKPSSFVIDKLLSSSKSFDLCSYIDPRNGTTNDLARQLKQIKKTDLTVQEERGAEDLYVGYPMVMGKFIDGTALRCPLSFIPVSLLLENNKWKLSKKEDGIFLNRSFILAYSHFNQVKVDEELLETDLAEFGGPIRPFLTNLYQLLKQSSIELNFNSDLFDEKLEDYKTMAKSDFDDLKNGELKLYPQAVLGIYPQTGSYITADYDYLLQSKKIYQTDSLETYFSNLTESPATIKEENLRLPLAVDASQEAAICAVKSGKSLVIQGPPGTGKSQLISNLMADYAAHGKKVLLVCQKRAAIDTVNQRLASVGMEAFTALVHDFKADRKNLYSKIAKQIDNILAYKHQNQSLNAIFLEREFDAASRKIDKLVASLTDFKTALFDQKEYGKPVKDLYLQADKQTQKELDLSEHFRFFHFDTLSDFLQKLETLEAYKNHLESSGECSDFWKNRLTFHQFGMTELEVLHRSLKNIAELKGLLLTLGADFDLEVQTELDLIQEFREAFTSKGDFEELLKFSNDSSYLNSLQDSLKSIQDLDLEAEDYAINDLDERLIFLKEANEKFESITGRLSWKLLSKTKNQTNDTLAFFKLETDKEGIRTAFQKLEDLKQLQLINGTYDFEEFQTKDKSASVFKHRIDLLLKWNALLGKANFAQRHLESYENFKTFLSQWESHLTWIKNKKNDWTKVLSQYQIYTVSPENVNDLSVFLHDQFDNLVARDQLYQNLTATERNCFQLTEARYDANFATHFKRNLILHMIDDLEQKSPILRSVSSLQLSLWEKELRDLLDKKKKFSREYLLVKLREFTYKNIEKNRLGNTTTYRELKHQTTKKRQIWPVRKTLESFRDEIFDLIPCWMASPETVSCIFPLAEEPIFDLVIFDEASQCFTENGLPAMLRGKQVVIAGDSKQLQPSDLYRVQLQEDEDLFHEIESLLELSSHFLPETTLKGHFRSQSIDLIDFSNRKFYDGKLKLLPEYDEINGGEPAIEFFKVNGVWDKNTNEVEAEKVLELVKLLRTTNIEKSIGVVTFNFFQAELISEKLLGYQNITVKNIENIQGDEFDIVIFSIGYAQNAEGKLRLNFGSLSQKGGENRLNVAITRAKEKIFIVTSISPEELDVSQVTNAGPILLKEYLEYARDVSQKKFSPSKFTETPKSWTKLLKDDIMEENVSFSDKLPFADLMQTSDGQIEQLLLTDDVNFYEAESIKESFAYLPQTLKNKNWTYDRVWSRNWWQQSKLPPSLLEEKEETE
ncbi:AAA domain-containing protein [Jiulongibacter sp. NS-SX5]|uniref:AAA domain-containing protein n=1 Tax=Jiulongibacter sp. NS-SX5 TaxID=3463854 RepID=UPI0040588B05